MSTPQTVKPPPRTLSDQKLADMWQTAQMGDTGCNIISSPALAALTHELLWRRQAEQEASLYLKLSLNVKELVEDPPAESTPPGPMFTTEQP